VLTTIPAFRTGFTSNYGTDESDTGAVARGHVARIGRRPVSVLLAAAGSVKNMTHASLRADGRADDELRPVRFTRGFQLHPAGSVLVEFGGTKVLCAASATPGVPRWRQGSGLGWLTAEYAMLPSSTHQRSERESVRGKVKGRTQEISRLIGRSLRACIDLAALGENTIAIDCDVLQADGGTRTAAITGAYIALADAVTYLGAAGALADPKPLSCQIAAISVGVIDGRVRLDLPYEEDSRAEVDLNVVATDAGMLVEVQGTAEGTPFPRATLDRLLDSALTGIAELTELQRQALAEPYPHPLPQAVQ
jgi:ribonuclease PH